MELRKLFSAFLLMLAVTTLTVDPGRDTAGKQGKTRNSRTWVNSPQVEFTPDGDRVSNYPPYHQPSR